MLLFYLRHGDPIYDPDTLTPLGHRQAEALGRRLARYGLKDQHICVQLDPRAVDREAYVRDASSWRCRYSTGQTRATHGSSWLWTPATAAASGRSRTKKYIQSFLSADVRAMGEKWPEHPDFAGTTLGEGIARVKRETYAFLAELGYVYDEQSGAYRTEGGNDERVALFARIRALAWRF